MKTGGHGKTHRSNPLIPSQEITGISRPSAAAHSYPGHPMFERVDASLGAHWKRVSQRWPRISLCR